jgi:hypothetical protein
MWCKSHLRNVRFAPDYGDNLLYIIYANVRPPCYNSRYNKINKFKKKKKGGQK